MKKFLLGAIASLALVGAALAQSYQSGSLTITSLVGTFSMGINTTGPQGAKVLLHGGTFTCSAGAATVSDTFVNSGSIVWYTLKTVGGTVAQPFIATITSGTGFTVTCGGSDTSTYNYVVFG